MNQPSLAFIFIIFIFNNILSTDKKNHFAITQQATIISNTIKKLATQNDSDPMAIIKHLNPIKNELAPPHQDALFLYFIVASFDDTTAYNWVLHASKANLQSPTSTYLLIPNCMALVVNKKYSPLSTDSASDSTDKGILRINGKNFKHDYDNGTPLSKEQIIDYFSYSFKPTIYPDLIEKKFVEEDRDRIRCYLLCNKAWTKKTNIKIPKMVNNHYIIPQLCAETTYSLKMKWALISNNMQEQIELGIGKRKVNDSLKPHEEFFSNYNKWFIDQMDDRLNLTFPNVQNIFAYHFSKKEN